MKETITLESKDLDFILCILKLNEARDHVLLQSYEGGRDEFIKKEFDRTQEVIAKLNEARGTE